MFGVGSLWLGCLCRVPGPAWPLMVLPLGAWEDEEMLLVLSWSEDLGA